MTRLLIIAQAGVAGRAAEPPVKMVLVGDSTVAEGGG